MEDANSFVHAAPVWAERANSLIRADLAGDDTKRWEQIPARRQGLDQFEVCCIPFRAYELALGDVVTVDPATLVIRSVARDGGRSTHRVWFDTADAHDRDRVERTARASGAAVEWWAGTLLAIDTVGPLAPELRAILVELMGAKSIEVETAKAAW